MSKFWIDNTRQAKKKFCILRLELVFQVGKKEFVLPQFSLLSHQWIHFADGFIDALFAIPLKAYKAN